MHACPIHATVMLQATARKQHHRRITGPWRHPNRADPLSAVSFCCWSEVVNHGCHCNSEWLGERLHAASLLLFKASFVSGNVESYVGKSQCDGPLSVYVTSSGVNKYSTSECKSKAHKHIHSSDTGAPARNSVLELCFVCWLPQVLSVKRTANVKSNQPRDA